MRLLTRWCLVAALSGIPFSDGEFQRPTGSFRWGATSTAVGVFMAWVVADTLFTLAAGQPRPSLNVMWTWLAGGVLFFLARQLIRTSGCFS